MTDPDTGAFIWYELMTPDPDAAKTFYDAVIGWDIAPRDPGEGRMDYRMIRRSDGGMAGGVLALSREMLDGGARPAWYGYVHVADVDAAKQAFVAAGGTASRPDDGGCGPHGARYRPARRAALHHDTHSAGR